MIVCTDDVQITYTFEDRLELVVAPGAQFLACPSILTSMVSRIHFSSVLTLKTLLLQRSFSHQPVTSAFSHLNMSRLVLNVVARSTEHEQFSSWYEDPFRADTAYIPTFVSCSCLSAFWVLYQGLLIIPKARCTTLWESPKADNEIGKVARIFSYRGASSTGLSLQRRRIWQDSILIFQINNGLKDFFKLPLREGHRGHRSNFLQCSAYMQRGQN